MNAIFKNYHTFYNMVLSTTMMSNALTPSFEVDAKAIIDFIGKAYKKDDAFNDTCKDLILEQLSTLGLTTDQQAVYNARNFEAKLTDNDVLFDIKGDVLTKLQDMMSVENSEINAGWFDYSHYKTYQADVRFAKIRATSATGHLLATRQVGILHALGIGCDVDLEEAVTRLTQCVFWGDIPSVYYLAHTYNLMNNIEKAKLFYELAELEEKYLRSGFTVLPDCAKRTYSEEACVYYAIISSIKQDVVYAYNKSAIDFSFIEAIRSDTLDYFDRMRFINEYDKKQWKNVTNSAEKPSKKIGFN